MANDKFAFLRFTVPPQGRGKLSLSWVARRCHLGALREVITSLHGGKLSFCRILLTYYHVGDIMRMVETFSIFRQKYYERKLWTSAKTMFRYSFSTVMMSLLTTSLLTCMLAFCLRYKGILYSIGTKLTVAFLLIVMLRLFLPFELPFCRNVNLYGFVSKILSGIQHPYFYLGEVGISLWSLFQCVWICGTVISLGRLIHASRVIRLHVRKYGVNVSAQEPYCSVFRRLCRGQEASMPILLVPGLDAPQQDRILRPRILLPVEMTFSEEQLRYIFRHELTHARHFDVLTKLLLNLLVALYWWNPLIRPLRKQADVLLEMRVDDHVVAGGDKEEKMRYAQVLMGIVDQAAELLAKQSSPDNVMSSNSLIPKNTTDLEDRVHLMFNRKKASVPLTLLLLTLTLSVSVLSYLFIFEAYTMPSPISTWELDSLGNLADLENLEGLENLKHLEDVEMLDCREMYAVKREEGGYDIYWDGRVVDHVDDMIHYSQIPVREP